MTRVSVALPVHNGMPYLRDAVASILGQTFADLELVICDDRSADGSASRTSLNSGYQMDEEHARRLVCCSDCCAARMPVDRLS